MLTLALILTTKTGSKPTKQKSAPSENIGAGVETYSLNDNTAKINVEEKGREKAKIKSANGKSNE